MKFYKQQVRELKEKKAYSDLVELLEYLEGQIQDSSEKDDAEGDSERGYMEGVSFLQEALPELRNLLQDNHRDQQEKRVLVRGMGLIPYMEASDVRQLVDMLVKEDDYLVRKAAFEVLTKDRVDQQTGQSVEPWCRSPYLSHVTKILRNTAGKRLSEYLPELITRAEDPRLIEDSLKIILSHKSWLVKQHCEFVVKDDTKFFLAYEFENKQLHEVIAQYFQKHEPPHHVETAGKGLLALTVSGEIIK